MKVTNNWLDATGADFSPGLGTSGCAHLTHYTVEYCEWGSGPPLVLVPGLAGGYQLLGPFIRNASKHFRVISYQLRGEDNPFALRRPFGVADLARDLSEFLDWHRLENPVVVGVSFGGLIALEFAARFPHRVEKLAVQGVGAYFEKNIIQRVAGTVLSRFPLPTDNPFINQFFNLLFGGPQVGSPVFDFVTRQCWQTDQSVIAYRFALAEQFRITDRLENISVPALLTVGDRDVLVSQRSLKELRFGLREAQLAVVPGGGHLAAITHSEFVGHSIKEFVEAA